MVEPHFPVFDPSNGSFGSWLKDFWGIIVAALVTGILALYGVIYTARQNKAEADRKDENDEQDRARQNKQDRIEANAAQTDSLTRRFQALMDGYENRITDLTAEVNALREEVKRLRGTIEQQTKVCGACPRFRLYEADDAAT